jgi:nucleolar protein 56
MFMKVFVSANIVGVFAFDKKGKMVHYNLFSPDPELIAGRLNDLKNGELIAEEEALVRDLIRSGYKEIVWDKKIDYPGIKCLYEPENPARDILQRDFRKLAFDLHFVRDQAEMNRLLSQVNVRMTKKELRKEKKDVILMRAVGVIDELDKTINTLSEHMREWYGLYFPEAEKLIRDHDQLAKAIWKEGVREKLADKKVRKYADITAGMPFSGEDLAAVRKYAEKVHGLYTVREEISEYIKKESRKVIPNLSAVAGPLIACRLVAHAGGLEKLARMPTSTIQLLGAEKALFRHLRSKDKPPKFGVIFAHPLIQEADRNDKGRVARILASKLTMAARADFYTGKDMSEKLMSDIRAKLRPGKVKGK